MGSLFRPPVNPKHMFGEVGVEALHRKLKVEDVGAVKPWRRHHSVLALVQRKSGYFLLYREWL